MDKSYFVIDTVKGITIKEYLTLKQAIELCEDYSTRVFYKHITNKDFI